MKKLLFAIVVVVLAVSFTACKKEKTVLENSVKKCWEVTYEKQGVDFTMYYWGTEKEVKNEFAYLLMDDIQAEFEEVANTDEEACIAMGND